MAIKRITYTHREGGSRTINKEGNEIKEKTTGTKTPDKKPKLKKEVKDADT